MSAAKTHRHPSGISISFDAPTHRYTDSRGCSYTSVSTLIKRLFAVFDAPAAAARVATREQRPVAAVLADWAGKSAAACRLGTRAHAVAEAAVLGHDPRAALAAITGEAASAAEPESERERAAFAAAWSAAQQTRAGCLTVHPEAMLADPESLTAGTADLIVLREITGSNEGVWAVMDYKSNEHLDAESKYGERALPPYEHLQDCHLVRYSLQLHLYRWLLCHAGYLRPASAVALYIVHLAPGAAEPVWVAPLDLRAEADAIMRGRRAELATTRHVIARAGRGEGGEC